MQKNQKKTPNMWVFSHMTTNHVTLTCLLFWTQDAVESNGPVSRPTGLVPLQLNVCRQVSSMQTTNDRVSIISAQTEVFTATHSL